MYMVTKKEYEKAKKVAEIGRKEEELRISKRLYKKGLTLVGKTFKSHNATSENHTWTQYLIVVGCRQPKYVDSFCERPQLKLLTFDNAPDYKDGDWGAYVEIHQFEMEVIDNETGLMEGYIPIPKGEFHDGYSAAMDAIDFHVLPMMGIVGGYSLRVSEEMVEKK